MRSIAALRVVVGLAATALAAAGCGGSDADPLVGEWKRGDILLRFDPDGEWVVDTDGSLEDDVFTSGQYEQNGQRVSFHAERGRNLPRSAVRLGRRL